MTNFLVSSAGRRGHLVKILQSVAASTGGGNVVAIDASAMSAAGRLADAFEVVPRLCDPAFIESVLKICARYGISHIVPTIDTELPIYASSRDRFAEAGITVWVSSLDVVELASDKWLLAGWLKQHGFETPVTVQAREIANYDLSGQVIAKPRGGSASIGMRRCLDVHAARAAELPEDYIVQEVASGYEVTTDFAVDATGRIRGLGMRRRLEVRAGEVSKAVTTADPALRAVVERLAATLPGPFGVLNVQAFVDEASCQIAITEINPRFGGGFPLTWQAGGVLPLALLDDSRPRVDASGGMVMLRYDDAIFANSADLDVDL